MNTPDPDGHGSIEAGRDAYVAGHDQIIHIHNDEPGDAGNVSITPRQAEYPVRGRDSAVSTLLDAPSGTVHVICAAGGRGKTTVAKAVAEQAQSLGLHVWWVSAVDAHRFSAGMRALAARLGAGPDRLRLAWSRDGDAVDLVWELLGNHSHPWLLVIDNADDVRVLAGIDGRVADGSGWVRRPPSLGRLIVTSRNHNPSVWGTGVRLSSLDDLSPEHAVEMLYDRVGEQAGPSEQAAALADRLGHLPLMLHVAGLYLAHAIRSTSWPRQRAIPRTFHEYREALDDRFNALVDISPAPYQKLQPRDQVAMTWELSLELLADYGVPQARPLLLLLACFSDAPIPYSLVLSPRAVTPPALFASRTSEEELEQAVDALADFGLLARQAVDLADDPGAYTVILHPLIGETMRNQPDARDQRAAYVTSAAVGLSDAARGRDTHQPAHAPFWQLTASHLRQLCALATAMGADAPITAAEALTEVAVSCIEYATDNGVYPQADSAASDITGLAALLPAEHPAALRLRYHKSRLRDHHGDLEYRESECQAVLTLQRQVLGDRHPETLQTWHELAWVIAERGDFARAEPEFRTVLTYRRETLGEDHRDALSVLHDLAALLGRRGDWANAEAEYRALLDVQIRVLGAEYPNTLWTRNGLGWVLGQRGDLAGAEAQHRTALAIQQRTLGALHPDTLWTRHNIARVTGQRGDLAASEDEYRSLLADRTTVLGESHANTLQTWQELAGMMAQRGNLAGAEAEYRVALDHARQELGDEHPHTVAIRYDFAGVLEARGDLAEAEAEHQAIVATCTKALGEDYPTAVRSREALKAIHGKR